jgi:hypothetical protein
MSPEKKKHGHQRRKTDDPKGLWLSGEFSELIDYNHGDGQHYPNKYKVNPISVVPLPQASPPTTCSK